VNNTDAEGRLVLADGMYYAKEVLKAKTIIGKHIFKRVSYILLLIDMATLTGAQVMASGTFHAAILSNNDESELEAIKAGKKSGDLVHPVSR
jgi:probable aminopeptidase NPEPL1